MGDKGDKSAARPPEGCPAEAGGLFGPESALGFEHPSGTNARRPSQNAGSTHSHTHTHIYIYIYRRYHTITDVYTTALLLTKPSSDDDSGFRHGFGAEASLPLAQSVPALSYDTTRLCQNVVAL